MKKKKQGKRKIVERKKTEFNVNFIILILALVPLFFAGIFQGGYFPWEVYATLLLSLPAMALFLLKKVYKKEQIRKSGADKGIFVYLGIAFLSLFFTVYFHATLTEFYKVLTYISLFYIIYDSINSKKDVEFLLNAILLLGLILSALGILAFVGTRNHLQGAFFVFLKNSGLIQGLRISSTLQYANTFAAFLILQFFVAVGFLLEKKSLILKVVYGTLSLLFLITLLLTQSRGGIIAFILALIIYFVLARGNDRKISALGLAGVILVFASLVLIKSNLFLPVIKSFWNRVVTLLAFFGGKKSNLSLANRENMLKDSLKILKEHPIFGTGNGTYQYVYMKYRSAYFFAKFPHSIFFQVLDETGIVGAAAFLYMLYDLIRGAVNKIKKHYSILDVALFSGLIGMLIHAFIDFDWSLMFMPLLFFVGFAVLLQTEEREYFTLVCPLRKQKVETKKYTHSKKESNIGKLVGVYGIITVMFFAFLFPFVGARADFNAKRSMGRAPWQKTVSMFNTATNVDPLCSEYHYDFAHFYFQTLIPASQNPSQFITKAEEQYKAAIKHCPEFFLYHFELARLYLQTGNKKAIDEFTKAVQLNPIDAGGHAALGFAYLKLKKDTVMAKVQFEEALKLDPKNSDAYLGFGQLYEQMGDVEKAIQNYQLAVKYNRRSAYAYYRLGVLYEKQGRLPEAVRNLFYAVRYNPSLREAKSELYKFVPRIAILKPAANEQIKTGEEFVIQWKVLNDRTAKYCNIYLVPEKGKQTLIKAGIPFKVRSYKWHIPDNLQSGRYRIRIYVVSPQFMHGRYGNWLEFITSDYFYIRSNGE